MTKIPLTRNAAPRAKAEALRDAVRAVHFPDGAGVRVATAQDAPAFFELIADPEISGPIYTLPKPATPEAARAFIDRHVEEQARGDGLLLLTFDPAGRVSGYHDIAFWPQWSACELGGAIRRDRRNAGEGGAGAARAFDWLFNTIGVDLICETAALDNVRTRRLLERLGFHLIGEIESELPGGGVRQSLYFEITKAEWDHARSSKIG